MKCTFMDASCVQVEQFALLLRSFMIHTFFVTTNEQLFTLNLVPLVVYLFLLSK
jgi:hypothetical protein